MTRLGETEIENALRRTFAAIAPVGGTKRITHNDAARALIGTLAAVLAAAPDSERNLDRWTELFREKLESALEAAIAARRH
jgi:hypothetical protein